MHILYEFGEDTSKRSKVMKYFVFNLKVGQGHLK